MSSFFLGVSLLFLLSAFRQYRKVMLDEYRDKLFDLRSELRDYYLNNGLNMDSTQYVAMRNLLNGYIRYLEDNRFTTLVHFATLMKKRNVVVDDIINKLERSFITGDINIDKHTKAIRYKAVVTIQQYMLFTSCTVLALSLGVIPAVFFRQIVVRTCSFFAALRREIKLKMDARKATSPNIIEFLAFNYQSDTPCAA